MTKRFCTLFCTVAISLAAFAQQDFSAAEKVEKYSVQTNRFKDNWFIGANVGGQMYLGDYRSLDSKGKLITPAFEINAGKWFTPGIGLRVGFGGYQAKEFSNENGGFAYKQVKNGVYQTKWGMLNLHADVMLNLTNMFCGYREDRVYNAIPYASIGYLRNLKSDDNELGVGVGLVNRFRVSEAWDVNLELKAMLNNDVVDGIRAAKNIEGSAAIMAGVTYRFKNRGWQKGSGISVAEMQEVQRKLQEMNQENEQLNRKVDALNNSLQQKNNELQAAQQAAVKSGRLEDAMEYTAFFDINKAYLSKKEAVNLEAMANLIKKYPNEKFVITGYADKQTGSAEFNNKLSKLRAEAVYNTLVDKFGVDGNQLTIDYKGGVDTMYQNDSKLSRAAVVKLVK